MRKIIIIIGDEFHQFGNPALNKLYFFAQTISSTSNIVLINNWIDANTWKILKNIEKSRYLF